MTGTAKTLSRDEAPKSLIDLAAFEAAALAKDPFDHCIVENFIPQDAIARIRRDFPAIGKGGSFPLNSLDCGPALLALAQDLQSAEVAAAFGRKFGLDLSGRSTMITLRGWSRAKDGRIHLDSRDKLVTALVYLNDGWSAEGGKLRLLRSPHDLEDFAAEIAPKAGTLLAFRCGERAWHGHKPFVGERRSLQLNWVTSQAVARREALRHGLSARIKSWLGKT